MRQFDVADRDLIELSILEIFVLYRMELLKIPMVRHQILLEVRNHFQSISTGKIYRILDKFVKNKLIDELSSSSSSTQIYTINQNGIQTIRDAQFLINQFSSNVLIYFEELMPRIVNFIDAKGKTLLYDFEQIYNVQLLKFMVDNTYELYYLDDNNVYKHFQEILRKLKHSILHGGIIREPEKFFQTIICVYHDDVTNHLKEFHRVLDTSGSLIVLQTDATNATHFIHRILFNQFAPEFMRKSKKLLDTNDLDDSQWTIIEEIDLDGLHMIKLKRSH